VWVQTVAHRLPWGHCVGWCESVRIFTSVYVRVCVCVCVLGLVSGDSTWGIELAGTYTLPLKNTNLPAHKGRAA